MKEIRLDKFESKACEQYTVAGYCFTQTLPRGAKKVLAELRKNGAVFVTSDDSTACKLTDWLKVQMPEIGIDVFPVAKHDILLVDGSLVNEIDATDFN